MHQRLSSFDENSLVTGLLERLSEARIKPDCLMIGFSGGADSTALLMALTHRRSDLRAPLRAIHFNHGIHASAREWEVHCSAICRELGVELRIVRGKVDAPPRISLEQAARDFRYGHMQDLLEEEQVYLTAHQADDQIETLLLNLLRGSGPRGLAGIPAMRRLGAGWVIRPMLTYSRDSLETYLTAHGLEWLSDPANEDAAFDRNFLRWQILPALESRWPGTRNCLHRSATLARSETETLAWLLSAELDRRGADAVQFPLHAQDALARPVLTNLLRRWMQLQSGSIPPYRKLTEFVGQLDLQERQNANRAMPEMRWSNWLAKRYRRRIWLHREDAPGPCPQQAFEGGRRVELGTDVGWLSLEGADDGAPPGWQVHNRAGAPRMRLHRGGVRRPVKDLLRESGIPPWLRDSIPLLSWNDEPVAIGDWLVAPRLREWLSRNGSSLVWKPGSEVLARLQSYCHESEIDVADS